ncbi:unnamed protein product [Rotaria sordida]|uniref:Transmembrane protein n=1 Tax=Rotaria sordida TaxID=392033 RepID=A0A813QQ74_9BILA|nr:unnamed protein product [Rotaria sordida]CAF3799850.1 unnamed protein product [Rotaria sordida]
MILSVDKNQFYSQIQSVIIHILSTMFTTLIISIGLVISTQISGYHLQNVYFSVNKNDCTCNCWDGFFRGKYSRGGYKIFYFNYEKHIIILLSIILFYSELLRQFLLKIIIKKNFILLLLIPSIYSNFYGIWTIINYLNDRDYYRMLKSQIFFSLTELIITYIFYQCLIIKNKIQIPIWSIYLLFIISFLHIILAFGELNFDQFVRNITLILSDLINLIWIIIKFIQYPQLRPNIRTIYIWLFIALCLWSFYYIVCQFRE